MVFFCQNVLWLEHYLISASLFGGQIQPRQPHHLKTPQSNQLQSKMPYVIELAGIIDMGKSSQVLGPADIKYIFVKGQETSDQQLGKSNIWVFNPPHKACKAPVEQPRQVTEEAVDNAVPETPKGKQTLITDFFSLSPTTTLAEVPRSFDTIRVFTKARSIMMRDEEDEEDEEEEEEGGVTPKEKWRLNLIHLGRMALFMTTSRFVDACGAAFMFTFTISIIIYGVFHLTL